MMVIECFGKRLFGRKHTDARVVNMSVGGFLRDETQVRELALRNDDSARSEMLHQVELVKDINDERFN